MLELMKGEMRKRQDDQSDGGCVVQRNIWKSLPTRFQMASGFILFC
jgi:hypothetical protein